MLKSRTVAMLSAAATLAVAGLVGAQTVDPFALTVTPAATTPSVTILPGLITVAAVTPASTPVLTPAETIVRPGRSP